MKKFVLLSLVLGALGLQAADLSDGCKEYFAEIDKFVQSQKDNAAMQQAAQMYEQQKAQFASLPKDAQDSACKPALEQLKAVLSQLPATK